MKVLALLLALLLVAPSATAETTQPPEQIAEGPSRIAVAYWCAIKRGGDDDGASCDKGIAAAVFSREYQQGWASLVGFGGLETLGLGGGWTLKGAGPMGDRLSVGAGVAVPHGDDGIDLDEWRVVLGANYRIGGGR